jgi:hypothetical protein
VEHEEINPEPDDPAKQDQEYKERNGALWDKMLGFIGLFHDVMFNDGDGTNLVQGERQGGDTYRPGK